MSKIYIFSYILNSSYKRSLSFLSCFLAALSTLANEESNARRQDAKGTCTNHPCNAPSPAKKKGEKKVPGHNITRK